jgi:hypothetical protein
VAQTDPRLVHVNGVTGGQSRRVNRASDLVLASIQHNVDAYQIVASSKYLTFDLEVYSDPRGATISYKLRGDEYKTVEHETDWIIRNIPRAVYFVRLQMQGCKDEEQRFDAITDPGTSIHVALKCPRGLK